MPCGLRAAPRYRHMRPRAKSPRAAPCHRRRTLTRTAPLSWPPWSGSGLHGLDPASAPHFREMDPQ
uniref:Uncharacterized protein n=1 Tax=Arundo donax TaxID=35708 RepID=A0A0A8ZUW2_ARUDO